MKMSERNNLDFPHKKCKSRLTFAFLKDRNITYWYCLLVFVTAA